jgi:membrane dipeptidase
MTSAKLEWIDHRDDPAAWARTLGVSREAVELYLASDVIDLHIDSFIWARIFGYDLGKRHGHGPLGARYLSQVDFPRLREAAVTGGLWSITTNPLRPRSTRPEIFLSNLAELRRQLARFPADFALARNVAEYRAARRDGKHAAFIVLQGGNALDRDREALDLIPDDAILLVTLVHLSTSSLGITSAPSPWRDRGEGLSALGKAYVQRLNAKRIFVDLAHICRRGFFDALAVHDKSQPVIVSHTGISGVHPSWRNLDDEQVKAVADTGGVVGIMYQSAFLGGGFWGCPAELIVRHLEHVIRVAGDDFCSLGSDWDGLIAPPRDMPTCLELPRLVQLMLERGFAPERVRKILGGNFLRALELLRGAEAAREGAAS